MKRVYAVPSMTFGDVARLQAAMTTVDTNMLRRVQRIPYGSLPSDLKWTQATSNTDCNYEVPMV
jgi:hypothetical protein